MSPRKTDDWEGWVRTALRGGHLREPPAPAVRRARALGSRLRPERAASTIWDVVRLMFDSAARPLPAGVRGAAATTRRLLYRASAKGSRQTCQVDLHLRRTKTGFVEMTGQLLPPWEGARVEARAGRTRRTGKMGDSGEFVIHGLPGRASAMQLVFREKDGAELVIPEVPALSGRDEDA